MTFDFPITFNNKTQNIIIYISKFAVNKEI